MTLPGRGIGGVGSAGAFARRFGGRRGVVLLLVVMVLTSMLVLGTTFMHNIRLDFRAAVNYSRTGHAEVYALDGLHRAMAELMYDVWGVNEDQAFCCAPEWGQLSRGLPVNGSDMVAAYAYDGSEQIVAPRALWRRTTSPAFNGTTNVETDFRWVDLESLKAHDLPIHSGGYYWDEFLPDGVDNADIFEASLMVNHGSGTDRDYYRDEASVGGLWSGHFWPAGNLGPNPPWDYMDTRIVPDSPMHIFRFDLIAPDDHAVHCTGVRSQDPKQPILEYRKDPDFRATHLATIEDAGWLDPWGGALNINQVNNNYRWELFYNWKEYTGKITVPQWSEHHFREAKWINIYDVPGNRVLGRYGVTVSPDCGTPNPNYMYDGRLGATWNQHLMSTALYLKSLDLAFTPHGLFAGGKDAGDDTLPNKIKSKVIADTPPGLTSWFHRTCTRFAQHRDTQGLITSRAELAVLLRKWGFDPDGVSEEELVSDARIVAAMISPSSYEYTLGPHWRQDRLVIDSSDKGVFYGNPEALRAYKHLLDGLQYYWGPDERNGAEDTYAEAFDPNYRWTPYHENDPDAPVPTSEWDYRARRAKAVALAWMMTNTEHEGHIERSLVACNVNDLQAVRNPSVAAMGTGAYEIVAMNPLLNVSEVGRFIPIHPTKSEHVNGDGSIGGEGEDVGFDATDAAEYYFLELSMYWAYDARDVAKKLPSGACIYVNGKDILLDQRTRIVARNPVIPSWEANMYGPSDPARFDWSYSDLCIMIAPSNHSSVGSKTNIRVPVCVSHDRNLYAFADAHLSGYMTIYFPAEGQYDGEEIVLTRGAAAVDHVRLPGRISDLRGPAGPGTGYSYSSMMYSNNGHPGCWQKDIPASPGWHKMFVDHVGRRWIDGQNNNYFPQAWPAHRTDLSNIAKRMDENRFPSYAAAGRSVVMKSTRYHYPFRRAQQLRATPCGFTSETPYSDLLATGGVFDSDGYYDPYVAVDHKLRTWALHHYFDGDLVSWHDLMRSAPLERVMSVGLLQPWGMGALADPIPSIHTSYPLFDGLDNNLDGLTDDLTSAPLLPSGVPGHYFADRKSMGRVNLNLLSHPSAVFYAASYANWNPTVQVGRKPLKGYNSMEEWETRLMYYQSDATPYDKIVWHENLFADCSSDNMANQLQGHIDTEMEQTAAIGYVGCSPVFTVYITAQTVDQDEWDPDIMTPTSEVKVRATVERTWDGKMNIIEFNWIPQDVW